MRRLRLDMFESPSYPSQNGYHQEYKKQQKLRRIGGKGTLIIVDGYVN
jgi:hypothetical protein